eukprot:TRINITY_DN6885_c0_g1_i1.p1 TRINITY_DN6885_c0_g1~~TRINITY_DN6885_c0_g1_i1.p1  ORF type:complete len:808 (-),score=237.76 TRINITY_DN6885_c0_g1_i1:38-2359(-)
MKYGKNQWARIASLLSRKTAKQCKARWYEWLDPSIKKTEWSREEEEKLLHMAKIMPHQWASIAPVVGRTSAQCLEHYAKLIDAATGRDDVDPADDPRRLRPGEIDPDPESKPALPDRIDMEEVEKEMLQEARARLANTQGKKAKRKAREKQLEEARRLAAVQKRRELKAAGITAADGPQRKKKKKNTINYNEEIPFQIRPAPGFHSVGDELSREKSLRETPVFKPILLQQLEGERRDEIEAAKRKKDIAEQKEREKRDPLAELAKAKEAKIRRTALSLPGPQMSDAEIYEISKLGYQPTDDSGNEATKDLLSNYAPTPSVRRTAGSETPHIADRTPARANTIMMAAQNLSTLTEMATPLIGGDNPELHPSDFSGATPRHNDLRTPNPLATPGGVTPRVGGGKTLIPGTPARDAFNLNEADTDEFLMEEEQAAAMAHKIRDAKDNLLQGLASLPKPREYRAQVPDDIDMLLEEDATSKREAALKQGTSSFVVDVEDLIKQKRLELQQAREAEMEQRSSALKKDLPRPWRVNAGVCKSEKEIEAMPRKTTQALEELATELIKAEIVNLLTHDAVKYPTKEVKPPAKVVPEVFLEKFETFDARELRAAKKLVDEEMAQLTKAYGQWSLEEYVETWETCQKDLVYLPHVKKFSLVSKLKSEDAKGKAFQQMYENTVEDMKRWNKKALGVEKKASLYTQGYIKVSDLKENEIFKIRKQIDEAKTELECFKAMKEMEDRALPARIAYWQKRVQTQREQEKELQARYASLVEEKQKLMTV